MDEGARSRRASDLPLRIGRAIKSLLGSARNIHGYGERQGLFQGKTVWAVIAHQRCGTNFFESMLRAIPGVYHYPEVLYPEFFEGSFYAFYADLVREEPRYLLVTDFTIVDDLFQRYFAQHVGGVGQRHVGFDLKIDQVDCYPRLYHCLKAFGFRILHLRRENRLRRVISHLVMQQRLKACADDIHRTPPELVRLTVDCADVVGQIKADMRGDEGIESRLGRGNPRYLQITYEGLARDRRRVLARVTDFLGLDADLAAVEPDTLKQGIWPLEKVVTNFDELCRALQRNNLHYELD